MTVIPHLPVSRSHLFPVVNKIHSTKDGHSLEELVKVWQEMSVFDFESYRNEKTLLTVVVQSSKKGYEFSIKLPWGEYIHSEVSTTKEKLIESLVNRMISLGWNNGDDKFSEVELPTVSSWLVVNFDKLPTKEDIWKIIENMNWPKDNNYERIQYEISNSTYFPKDQREELYQEYRELYEKLELRVTEFLDKENIPYCNGDSFSDTLADIVGSWKVRYQTVLSNPSMFPLNLKAKESFAYVWQQA